LLITIQNIIKCGNRNLNFQGNIW